MEQCVTSRLWQGLRTVTDYRGQIPSTVSADASLADYPNSFYTRFEASNNTVRGTVAEVSSIARDEQTRDPARCEEGSDEGEHQESCRIRWHIWMSTEDLC